MTGGMRGAVTGLCLVLVLASLGGGLGDGVGAVGASGTGSATGPSASTAATGNTAPFVDAGLDQTVVRNQTVYLDALGSYDPDGDIVSFDWAIERPDGSRMVPACRDCPRTHFQVHQVGQYAVTVTATDDDGASRADTLYVNVTAPNPPTVTLSGPDRVSAGDWANVTAYATASTMPLARLRWFLDGEKISERTVVGERLQPTWNFSFHNESTHTVRIEVVDRLGRTASNKTTITVGSGGSLPFTLYTSGNLTVPEGTPVSLSAYVENYVVADQFRYDWTVPDDVPVRDIRRDGRVLRATAPNVTERTTFEIAVTASDDARGAATESLWLTVMPRSTGEPDPNDGPSNSDGGGSGSGGGGGDDLDGIATPGNYYSNEQVECIAQYGADCDQIAGPQGGDSDIKYLDGDEDGMISLYGQTIYVDESIYDPDAIPGAGVVHLKFSRLVDIIRNHVDHPGGIDGGDDDPTT